MTNIGDSSVITNLIEDRTQMYSLIYDLQEKVRNTKEEIKIASNSINRCMKKLQKMSYA